MCWIVFAKLFDGKLEADTVLVNAVWGIGRFAVIVALFLIDIAYDLAQQNLFLSMLEVGQRLDRFYRISANRFLNGTVDAKKMIDTKFDSIAIVEQSLFCNQKSIDSGSVEINVKQVSVLNKFKLRQLFL